MTLDTLLQYLTPSQQRLAAADFATLVLPLYEAAYPSDDRPRKAIDATRQFVRGQIDRAQLDAAWAAAGAAAGDAVRERMDQQQVEIVIEYIMGDRE